ncbi:hypothetical protein ACFY2Z_41030 [Streptomyces sp. NPDC001222]|uniref:hypothetical protein n=1 Tax=Streptomyces sp. NPDC001222 TaxID=3364548 RepID=UPI0036A9EE6E
MYDAISLTTLAVAGVLSLGFISVKGLLDQLPDVIDSAAKVRDAWRRFRRKPQLPPPEADERELAPVGSDQEPPAAA